MRRPRAWPLPEPTVRLGRQEPELQLLEPWERLLVLRPLVPLPLVRLLEPQVRRERRQQVLR